MISIAIENMESAVCDFNNQLNNYYQSKVANERPYFGYGAMLDYIEQLSDAMNEGTDLTWEIGKTERSGYVASFSPSEQWEKKYLLVLEAAEREDDQ